MGPEGIFSVGDRVIAAANATLVPPGTKGTILNLFAGRYKDLMHVRWITANGEEDIPCRIDQIKHIGVLDALGEL